MIRYVTPTLLLATFFARSLAEGPRLGPSEFTIGQGWDANNGVEGVFQDECVIQDKSACKEQATSLGYTFVEGYTEAPGKGYLVKGCFLASKKGVPVVMWRRTAQRGNDKFVDYSALLPIQLPHPDIPNSHNKARIYLCTTTIDKSELQAVGEESINRIEQEEPWRLPVHPN